MCIVRPRSVMNCKDIGNFFKNQTILMKSYKKLQIYDISQVFCRVFIQNSNKNSVGQKDSKLSARRKVMGAMGMMGATGADEPYLLINFFPLLIIRPL